VSDAFVANANFEESKYEKTLSGYWSR
jgi:hypothetical protein